MPGGRLISSPTISPARSPFTVTPEYEDPLHDDEQQHQRPVAIRVQPEFRVPSNFTKDEIVPSTSTPSIEPIT